MDEEDNPTLAPIKGADLWAMVPGVVTGIAAYVVCVSASRWLGFFLVIDHRLMAFMSVQDLIANSLSYLPFVFVSLAATGLFHLARGGRPYHAPKWAGFIYSGGAHPWRSLRNNFLIAALWVITADNWPFVVLLNGTWIYINVLDILEAHGLFLRHRLVPEYMWCIWFVVVTFVEGLSSAYVLPDKVDYELNAGGSTQQVVLIAEMQDFILVRLASGQVSAVSRSEVGSLTQLQPQPSKRKPLVPLWEWVGYGWASTSNQVSSAWTRLSSWAAGLFHLSGQSSPSPSPPSSGP